MRVLKFHEKLGEVIGINMLTPRRIKKHVNDKTENFSLLKIFNCYFIPFLIVFIPFSIATELANGLSIILTLYPSVCWLFFIFCFHLVNYFFGSKERKLKQLILHLSKLYLIVWFIWFIVELLTIMLFNSVGLAQIFVLLFILYGLILTFYIIKQIYPKLNDMRLILLICSTFLIMLGIGAYVWIAYINELLLG